MRVGLIPGRRATGLAWKLPVVCSALGARRHTDEGQEADCIYRTVHTPYRQPHTVSDDPSIQAEVAMRARYAGYIARERVQAERLRRLRAVKIPPTVEHERMPGLSTEGRTKLSHRRPECLEQAWQIPGVTLADVALLQVAVQCGRHKSRLPLQLTTIDKD